MCKSGRPMLCKDYDVMGATMPGCFSEWVLLPERGLVKVDDRVTDSEGACLQPLSDCVSGVETAGINIGDTVAFIGQGCLGINSLQVARSRGAGMLIAVDIRDDILKKSKQLGADFTIDAKKDDPAGAIKELTQGKGADIVFEAAGGNPQKGLSGTQTFQKAIECVRNEGSIVTLSIYGQPVEIALDLIRNRGIRILPPKMTTAAHLEYAMHIIASGQVRLKPIVTQILSAFEAVPKAFEITGNKGKYNSIMPAQVLMK